MNEMKQGAVAVLDALGFKGIWRRHRPGEVVATLRRIQERARGFVQGLRTIGVNELVISQFSDSLIIACPAIFTADNRDVSMTTVVGAARLAVVEAATNRPQLAYRGAISYGNFMIDGNFVVGPAIDEAASNEAISDGAFVILGVSALKHLNGDDLGGALLPYRVPLRDGRNLETKVVNPFLGAGDQNDEFRIEQSLREAFDDPSIEVYIKRTNTENFLDYAFIENRRRAEESKPS